MAFDSASKAYFDKVEAVSDFDLTAIETWLTPQYVKGHIDAYVRGLKADGVWGGMGDTGLMIGSRTSAGAMQKLAGDGELSVVTGGFDYDPRQGLVSQGDSGITTGQTSNGTQNNSHQWCWVSGGYSQGSSSDNGRFIGNGGASHIVGNQGTGESTAVRFRANNTALSSIVVGDWSDGMLGWSRGSVSAWDFVAGEASGSVSQSANASPSGDTTLFFQGVNYVRAGKGMAAWGTGTHVDLTKIRDRFAALRSALYSETESPVFGPSAAARRRLQAHRGMQRGGSWL